MEEPERGSAPGGGWTPPKCSRASVSPMPCHSQGTFGAHQGGSTTWRCPLSPQLCHSACERWEGGATTPIPSSPAAPQCCEHPELGVSGPRGTLGWRDSTQPSPITPQPTLRVLWGFLVGRGHRGAKPPSLWLYWGTHLLPPTGLGGLCDPPAPEPPLCPPLHRGVGNKAPPNAHPPSPGSQAPCSLPAPPVWVGRVPVSPPGCSEHPSPPIRRGLHPIGLLPTGGSFVAPPAQQRGGP